MQLAEPFATGSDAKRLTIFTSEHWTVLVRKSQVTIGSVVLAANRHFTSGSELTPEEAADFPRVVGRLERMLNRAFQFDKINYLCLMMVDRHYHFHVLPRYERAREFAGLQWVDNDWPKPTDLAAAAATDFAVLKRLRDYLATYS
ncbi:MAG TPA: HIT family protein [Candidatus Dormibacteraeota bacterium]|nr:HIT family protein [Candidatus Dormibacteraeota bacterium]